MIQNKQELLSTVRYIATQTSKMTLKLCGKTFPIKSLTVFSHSQEEYDLLISIIDEMGKSYNFNNGPRIELYNPIEIDDNKITYLRIRKPDIDRPQVGCNDFETDYETFKKEYLLNNQTNLLLIKRPEYEMIELRDNDFDVLAYVVSD